MSERIGLGVVRNRNGNLKRVTARRLGETTTFRVIGMLENGKLRTEVVSSNTNKEIYKKHKQKVSDFFENVSLSSS